MINFPKFPSNRTLIANPLSEEDLGKELYTEKLNKAKDILDKVKKRLTEMSNEELDSATLDEVLIDLEITDDSYHEALGVSQRGQIVVMKRKSNEM